MTFTEPPVTGAILKVLTPLSVSEASESTPVVASIEPPTFTVTGPFTVPEPPSVPPVATVTALPAASDPFTSSLPEFTSVVPV